MDPDPLVILDPFAGRGAYLEERVEPIRGQGQFFMTARLSTLDRGCFLAGQIEGDALSPAGDLDGPVVHLEASNSKGLSAGKAAHAIADFDLSAERRPGQIGRASCRERV